MKKISLAAAVSAVILVSGCSGDDDNNKPEVITPPTVDAETIENLSKVFNVDYQVMESICSDDKFSCSYDESVSDAAIELKNLVTLDYNLDTAESKLKEKIDFLYSQLSQQGEISDFMLKRPERIFYRFTFECKENGLCGKRPNDDFQFIENFARIDKSEKDDDGITAYSWLSLKTKDYTDFLSSLIATDGRSEFVTISSSISGQAWSKNTSCNNFEDPDECTDRWSWTTLTITQNNMNRESVKNFFEVVLQENQRQYIGG
ncbi:hypothetical protein LB048_004005 [Vibrio parahaemolyticus]|nr:hypothetical protein [Vibrio parahaemolyticus]